MRSSVDTRSSCNRFNPYSEREKVRHISSTSVQEQLQRKLYKSFSNSTCLQQPLKERRVIQSNNTYSRPVGISNSVPRIKIKTQPILNQQKQKVRTAAAPTRQQPSVRTSMKAATTRTERPVSTSFDRTSFERDQESLNEMYRKSSLSLLEQKKLQWAQEREELNGLWSPWGRPTDTLTSSMAASSSTTAIISSNYATRLGVSTDSQSEYHLPPISTTIAQQPRKSSLWSSDENTGNGPLYTNANNNAVNNNSDLIRKSSLPICIATSVGDIHFNGSNTVELKHHQYLSSNQYQSNNVGNNNHNTQNMNVMTVSNGWGSFDEDTYTSGYQSENNGFLSNGDGEYSRNGSGDYHHREEDQEQHYDFDSKGLLPRRSLKSGRSRPSARSRSEGGPKTYEDKSGGNQQYNDSKKKSKVIVHNILTENENRQDYEYTVNAMTSTELDSSNVQNCIYNSRSNPNLSQSGRMISNPPPPAMRSSITFGIDAANVADYKEIEKQEREQWLNELEKQREEQRLRREMEKEDRERPRWGDKGIGVGHFWEPSESTNARLPISSRGENDADAQSTPAWLEKGLHRMESSKSTPSLNEMDTSNFHENSPSPSNLIHNQHQSAIDLRNVAGFDNNDPNSERTYVRGQNGPSDPDIHAEREKKRQAALEHQEAIRKQMEERQAKLKQEREKKILEEKNEEERIARQQQLELERLEAERRKMSRVRDNDDDFSSSVISTDDFHETPKRKHVVSDRQHRQEFAQSKTKSSNLSTDDNTGRELAIRQSVFLPTLGESKSMININEEIVSQEVISEDFMREISRQDQSIMTEVEDLAEVRVLTPTLQRSHSFGTAREFGTQTEYSETNSSSEKSSAKNKSHTCLTEKGMEKEKKKKNKMEKPRWGENPVKKQYLKNSEKDPIYQQRLRRRMERMRRREDEILIGDTGTESEELHVPLNRQIRIRKNESPPRSLAPMRAKVPIKNFKGTSKDKSSRDSIESYVKYQSESLLSENILKKSSSDGPPGRNKMRANAANSEESSGFSSPSIEVAPRRGRDIGAGDSLEFEDFSYLNSMHQEHSSSDIQKTSRMSSSVVSEYMGELPSTIKNRKNSKSNLLPNKSTKASIVRSQERLTEEKSVRKSSLSKTTSQSQILSSSSRTAAELFDDTPIHSRSLQMSALNQQDSLNRAFEQRMRTRSPPLEDTLTHDSMGTSFEQRMRTRSTPIDDTLTHDSMGTSFEQRMKRSSHTEDTLTHDSMGTSSEQRMRRSPPMEDTLTHDSMGTSFEQRMRRSPPIHDRLTHDSMGTSSEQRMRGSTPMEDTLTHDSMGTSFEQRMRRSPPIHDRLTHDSMGTSSEQRLRRSTPMEDTLTHDSMGTSFEQRMRRSPPIHDRLTHDSMGTSFEQSMRRSTPIEDTLTHGSMDTSFEAPPASKSQRNPPISTLSHQDSLNRSFEQRMRRSPPIDRLTHDSLGTSFEGPPPSESPRNPPISTLSENSTMSMSFENRITSPPVPALLKKMQMGFNPDEFGRMSSLQSEFANSPPQSRAGSRVSTSGPRIDIDIAVTPRPEMKHTIFEMSDETEASVITTKVNGTIVRAASSHSITEESFESHESNEVSSNNGITFYDVPPGGVDRVVGMNPVDTGRNVGPANYRNLDRPLTNGSSQTDLSLSRQERIIFSVMNNDDVQAQLSARESELSEKGLIEFSVRLPSQTHTLYDHNVNVGRSHATKHDRGTNSQVESSLEDDDYQDPLMSARRNCVRWLYSTEETPKESVLAHLSYLKKGIMMQQQEWGVLPSDTEEEIYESRR